MMRFHSLNTKDISVVQILNLPNRQALALGEDGRVYAWRDSMGLWFGTIFRHHDWFELGLRAMAETEGRAQVRSGKFTIRAVQRGY